ncbi:MAG: LON peptidase substrate-binding domain-containing protein [Hyphomicrobiales bacterium]|nr:LON peptidase substrate-binding domain-containing protein [Hyphomicrobiales bacterium]
MHVRYREPDDVPDVIPVFPLTGALLLPRGQLPLNIFEPRYLEMIDTALASDRLIGMIQPKAALEGDNTASPDERTALCGIGTAGRLTSFQETQDGRYLVTLTGIARFKIVNEVNANTPFRQCRIDTAPYSTDFVPRNGEDTIDRSRFLKTFQAYLDANGLEADWDSVKQAGNEALVNALSMMCPYGPREKQALLEAEDLNKRAELLIAMTEMELAQGGDETPTQLQ